MNCHVRTHSCPPRVCCCLAAGMTVDAPAESRLKLSLPTLEGGTVLFRRFVVEPGRVIEETGEWAGPGHLPATAAMILSESAAGPPPTDPHDPEEVIDLFPSFNARRAGVGLLVDSQTKLEIGRGSCRERGCDDG